MQRRLSGKGHYYPPIEGNQWDKISPAALGWDGTKLEQAVSCVCDHNSTAFLIVHKGRIVVEEYWQDWGIDTAMPIFSAAKSVASVLVGIAQEEGKLSIGDRMVKYLGPGWSKAPPGKEAVISIKHVLTMTTGLNDSLEYKAEAGTIWYYNSPAYWKLFPVIESATGKSMDDFSREVLWARIGMKWCAWNGRTMACSARDMARFGLMVLYNGTWQGKDILKDKTFLRDATNKSQELNQAYGYLWWLNGENSFRLPGPADQQFEGALVPSAPADMFAALGAADKKIYIVPSLDLVVVRHGGPVGEVLGASSSFDEQLWGRFMPALKPE